ncbi:MAG TPA: tetratricopeptide repeat protein [Casimicrobiaceae bacterium]|jgi:Flp pilus assembly protein TadD|nr:tetratricopeptide repeat protein [Casimicrobiaceae bacterium]
MPRISSAIVFALSVALAVVPGFAGAADAGPDASPAPTAPTTGAAEAAPLAPESRGMDEAARKAYAAKLREAQGLVEGKRYADAIAILDALSAAHPREPQARFIKGVALMDEGRADDAVTQYRALVADFPELPEPHNNLAVLYARKGEYALARDELERAIAAAPDYAIAQENLGDVYVRLAEIEYQRAATLERANHRVAAKLELVKKIGTSGVQAPVTGQ